MDYEKEIAERIFLKEKTSLKKGSVQLPVAVWDYLESKAINGLLSTAGVVRNFIYVSIRINLMTDAKNITIKNLPLAKQGFIDEFKTNLAIKIYRKKAGKNANFLGEPEYKRILEELTEDKVFDYFTSHPDEFEEAKNFMIQSFQNLKESELVEIIGRANY